MRGLPVLRDLCRASLALYDELVRTENLTFHFERRGTLYVNSTDAGFEKTKREADLLGEHGFEYKILTGPETCEMEPTVLETVRGAAYYSEDAHGDSYLFVTGLGRLLPGLGVAVHTDTCVSGLVVNGQNQIAVTTNRGEFKAKNLVIAAGSWVPELARLLRVNIPIQPGKGYSVTVDRSECSLKIPLVHPERKVIITPIGDRLRFAGTMEFAGMDLSLNGTRLEAALRGGKQILRPPSELRNVERWCGVASMHA